MNLNCWSSGPEVLLMDLLDARESRVAVQKEMLKKKPACLVCLTLNIPGPVKVFPYVSLLYEAGRSAFFQIIKVLCNNHSLEKGIVEVRQNQANSGLEGYFSLVLPPLEIKKALIELEDSHPLGRLFDFDVLNPDGSKVSREALGYPGRSCLLCENPAFLCGRSRRHSARELFSRSVSMMDVFFEERLSVHIGLLMQKALFYEVNTFLKPGLVDSVHNGAHKDMTRKTFIQSAYSLTPYFLESTRLGLAFQGTPDTLSELFPQLRDLGKKAEQVMYAATKGVNTHKGLVFSGGILCCALGYHISQTGRLPQDFTEYDFRELSETAQHLLLHLLEDFQRQTDSESLSCTHGESLYRTYRLGGIRKEAAAGFPTLFKQGFPLFLNYQKQGFSLNQSGCLTLLFYISRLEDTNLFSRAGYSRGQQIQKKLSAFLSSSSPEEQLQILPALDHYFTEQHISPGGSADMLALTYFFYFLLEKPCCFF